MNVYYHLPGLFEFYEFYKKFLPLFKNKSEYFYDWCKIGSIYGSPSNCIWSGGRISYEDHDPKKVLDLMKKYNIPTAAYENFEDADDKAAGHYLVKGPLTSPQPIVARNSGGLRTTYCLY